MMQMEDIRTSKTISVPLTIAERVKEFKKKFDIGHSEVYSKGAIMFMEKFESDISKQTKEAN